MVVNNRNVVGSVISPEETDTPLVVDSNAVLAFPVTLQGFQAVATQAGQVSELHCLIEAIQAAFRLLANVLKAGHGVAFIERLRVLAAERPDHYQILSITLSVVHTTALSDKGRRVPCLIDSWAFFGGPPPRAPSLSNPPRIERSVSEIQPQPDVMVLSPGARAAFDCNPKDLPAVPRSSRIPRCSIRATLAYDPLTRPAPLARLGPGSPSEAPMTTTESLRKLLQDMVLPELNQIRAEQAEQKNTLRLLQARVEEMSKRLDQVDAHLIDQSRRIDATNARIDQVRSELTERIEKVYSDLILRNDETNRSIARLYEVIVRRDEHVELAARLSRLEHEVAEINKKLAA